MTLIDKRQKDRRATLQHYTEQLEVSKMMAENERLSKALKKLIAAADGIDNMDAADGVKFWTVQDVFDNALEDARAALSGEHQ